MRHLFARFIVALALVASTCLPARATQIFLPSTYVNQNGCALPPSMSCEVELTSLALTDTNQFNNDIRFVLFNLVLNNTLSQNPTQSPPLQISLRVLVDGSDSHSVQITPAAGLSAIQLPFTLQGLAMGPHTYQFFVAQNSSGPISYTTDTYGGVFTLSTLVVTTLPTPTPLAFGTPGVLSKFGAPELQPYAGAVCPTPAFATGVSASGALTCATPIPPTPQPTWTATPTATATNTATPTNTPTATPTP